MNIKDFEYFHKLVKEKNFSKVAQSFSVSQPTVTLAIKRLEEEFKTTFFIRDRSHKELIVTPSGYQFDQHLTVILNELAIAKKEAARADQEKLLFGLPPIIGNYFFPKIVANLISTGLIEQLETKEAGSEALLKLLLDGSIDFCLLGSLAPLTQESLIADTFAKTPFKIIVGKQHPLAIKKAIHFSELKNERFIVHTEGFIHDKALKMLARHNHFKPDIIYRTNYVHVLKSMVESNTGIACLADLAIAPNDNFAVLDLLDEDQPEFLLSIVRRSTQYMTPTKEKLLKIIHESVYHTPL
ncbi:LysR family transcriptional regulator [Ligilactobacillus apodemi]|uniref:LysR family transcriptional regulator n=1 Tax=Ligilactobacillus apodemi DSM 16634 = JCM 16172 TaxID=1423724 RepID=A0A0R1TPK8_9LACO|nr:LysR family transcriptional regulator [Ligilactobacillus apodemi]KRL83377.1 LysR family transcriptional regulator [Ligilactobacillus apodemi DSM 16634 = JCM 16172]